MGTCINHPERETPYICMKHQIYLCEECGDFRNVFWVRIIYDDDQIYETQFNCVSCHKPMVNLSDQIQQTKCCPLCGSDHLSCLDGLLWD